MSSLTYFVVATDHVLGGGRGSSNKIKWKVSEPAIQRGQFLDFQIGSGSGNANIDGGNGQQERSQWGWWFWYTSKCGIKR